MSGIHCSSSPIRERPQSNHLRTMNSASPLPVGPPGGDIRYVATEQCESSQLSVPRASSTAVFSSSTALNRRHGPMASTPPVSVQPSTLVINTSDPQPVPPSVQVVTISETTANQPTTVPEAQRAILDATQERIDSDPCHPSISVSSLPTMHEIRMVHHSPSPMRQSMPIHDVETIGYNNLADLLQESGTSGSYHTELYLDSFSLARYAYAD